MGTEDDRLVGSPFDLLEDVQLGNVFDSSCLIVLPLAEVPLCK